MKPVEIAERLWMVHPCRGVECCFDPEKVALQVAQMIAEEREACAKVAMTAQPKDWAKHKHQSEYASTGPRCALCIADAIRARGQG